MAPRRVVTEGFHRRVYAVVALVPAGAVTTYGDVAAAMGARSVARHVGWALAALPDGADVPWHRVLDARGRVSARADGPSPQQALLEAEGVGFVRGRVDLRRLRHRFDPAAVAEALSSEARSEARSSDPEPADAEPSGHGQAQSPHVRS